MKRKYRLSDPNIRRKMAKQAFSYEHMMAMANLFHYVYEEADLPPTQRMADFDRDDQQLIQEAYSAIVNCIHSLEAQDDQQ